MVPYYGGSDEAEWVAGRVVVFEVLANDAGTLRTKRAKDAKPAVLLTAVDDWWPQKNG